LNQTVEREATMKRSEMSTPLFQLFLFLSRLMIE
jgi:hypothetical protein